MKSILISSNCSGGGKTTVTLGIMKAVMDRGFKVQGYKVGPDYIDTAFHKQITGQASRNLDLHLMGEEGLEAVYSRGKGDYAVVEGVMGLYDGKGITSEYSTAQVAKMLDLPIILVITPKAQSLTLCAELNGMVDFESANIVGIILNNISEGYYKLLKAAIEKNCIPKLKVLGYLPNHEGLQLKSRHLGLVQSSEVKNLEDKIQLCSELLEQHVDMEALLNCFVESKKYEDSFHYENRGLRTAVAYDKAFNFYYKENLEALEELGEVIYFSPLKDKKLPENIDFLYIGGGYPEVFVEELSKNISMLDSIKHALEAGLKCYAECGGLMYLSEEIQGHRTVGFLKGKATMGKSLQHFGYAEITVLEENPFSKIGSRMNCHEFHKSFVELQEKTIFKTEQKSYDGKTTHWSCGYCKKNTVATYGHTWGRFITF